MPLLSFGRESGLHDDHAEDGQRPASWTFPQSAPTTAEELEAYNTENRPLLDRPRSKSTAPLVAGLRSFNFLPYYNDVYRQWFSSQPPQYFKRIDVLRWAVTAVLGIVTALVAVLITFLMKVLSGAKFSAVRAVLANEISGSAPAGASAGILLCFAALYAGLAALPVIFLAPVAGGSGISEIKCLLNGIKIPKAVRVSTLFAKMFGVVFATSAGLPVGPEGPMIHCGAIVGAGLSQGKSTTMKFDTTFSKVAAFRNDTEKRDFMVCGIAAGVAAAFGAPAGGVLFALEEGASYWFQALTWRAFACAVIGTYVFNTFLSGMESSWGQLVAPGMFTFGDFTNGNTNIFFVWEIPVFIFMGIGGGLLGAAFNAMNRRVTIWRLEHMRPLDGDQRRVRRLCEAVIISVLFASVAFLMPLIWHSCRPYTTPNHQALNDDIGSFYCKPGEYNEMASLFLSTPQAVILQLFHVTNEHAFSAGAMFLFTTIYMLFTCWALGMSVPSGLFIPSIVVGSGLGRIVGAVLLATFGNNFADPGTYALMGAAAFLGGMSRMTISVAVILLECTGDVQIGLPLMLTLMAARWSGNWFNEGIYDLHINLKRLPILEGEPPAEIRKLNVRDIMTPSPKCISMTPTVGDVCDLLRNCTHNSFPVLYPESLLAARPRAGNCAGIVLRAHLCVLLKRRVFFTDPPRIPAVSDGSLVSDMTSVDSSRLLSYNELDGTFPRYPEFYTIPINWEDRPMYMDLRGYMCSAPYLVKEKAPAMQAFELFRGLGMRQLIVTNDENNVTGVITREDIAEHSIVKAGGTNAAVNH